MGWDGCHSWKSASEAAQDLVSDLKGSGLTFLAGALVRDAGQQAHVSAWEQADGSRFAIVCLIERQGTCLMRKDMGEDMGPFFAACPPKVWDAIKDRPLPATWGAYSRECSAAWRDRVRARKDGPAFHTLTAT